MHKAFCCARFINSSAVATLAYNCLLLVVLLLATAAGLVAQKRLMNAQTGTSDREPANQVLQLLCELFTTFCAKLPCCLLFLSNLIHSSHAICVLCIAHAGMGDKEPGRPADDLVFVVAEKPHTRFTRDGNDLHTSINLSLLQALQGGSTQVRQRLQDMHCAHALQQSKASWRESWTLACRCPCTSVTDMFCAAAAAAKQPRCSCCCC
jgi:hypothetical protein